MVQDPTFTQPITGPVSAQGQTLYAQWLPNDYTIYYQANGGSGNMAEQHAVWNTPVTLAPNGFSRTGYTFGGWEDRYGDGQTYSDGQEVTNLAGEIQGDRVTLYAQWNPISYTPDQQPDSEEQPPQSNIVYSDVCETDWYYADVQYVSSHHMMQGYADGRFDPEGRLTRSQLAQILYNLEGRPAVNGTDRFYDTDPNAWYGPAMAWAVESGILTGYGNGNIGPNDPVTREQLAVMLLRYAQLNDLEVDGRADLSGYADSSAISGYALEAMACANAAGIVQGSGGKLLPGGTTSRAQTAAMLTRFSRQLPTA